MVVMLRQFCCGCTLKTGAIIIGVINAFGALANIIGGSTQASEASRIEDDDLRSAAFGVNVVVAVLGAIMLVFAFCLIMGAINSNPVLLVPWMVHTLIFLVVDTILFIFLGWLYIAVFLAVGVLAFIGIIVLILLEVYFLIVVYSLYRELKGTAPQSYV